MSLSNERQIALLEMIITLRRFEQMVAELYRESFIPGFVHLYIGEEAVAVGACAALRDDDYITSTHRGHGHCAAKGCDLKLMMAELFGKKTGYCKGKGGSMHMADFERGIIGAIGIVGGGFPIAVGCALSSQMRGTDQVSVCFFGDGASNQGTFHESLNLAAIWKLPVVFVCENNFFGISMRQSEHQAVSTVAQRAFSYGMPGVTVDGNDVLAVHAAVEEAVKSARSGGGPSLVECVTYRWRGHCESDPPLHSRSEKELEDWKEKCPIKRFTEKLIASGVITAKDVNEMTRKVAARIDEAVQFAKESPAPAPEEAMEDIYAEENA